MGDTTNLNRRGSLTRRTRSFSDSATNFDCVCNMIPATHLSTNGTQEMSLPKSLFAATLLLIIPVQSPAADSDLKPGDVIGPHNWQRVQGMVGENLLNRIKGGYTFKIEESRPRRYPKEYIAATSAASSPSVTRYAKGNPLKEVFTFWGPVKLPDGQEVIGPLTQCS